MKQTMPATIIESIDYNESQMFVDQFNYHYGSKFKPLKYHEIGVFQSEDQYQDTYYFLVYSGKRPSKIEIANMLKKQYNVNIQDLFSLSVM